MEGEGHRKNKMPLEGVEIYSCPIARKIIVCYPEVELGGWGDVKIIHAFLFKTYFLNFNCDPQIPGNGTYSVKLNLSRRAKRSRIKFKSNVFFAAEINFVVSKFQQSCPKICGSLLNGQRQSWELYLATTGSKKVGSRHGNAPLLRIRQF